MTCPLRQMCLILIIILSQVAVSFTSKEVHFYDTLAQPDSSCQYKLQVCPGVSRCVLLRPDDLHLRAHPPPPLQGLEFTPWCLDYWADPSHPDQAVLTIGDVGGQVCEQDRQEDRRPCD